MEFHPHLPNGLPWMKATGIRHGKDVYDLTVERDPLGRVTSTVTRR